MREYLVAWHGYRLLVLRMRNFLLFSFLLPPRLLPFTLAHHVCRQLIQRDLVIGSRLLNKGFTRDGTGSTNMRQRASGIDNQFIL